MSVSTIKQIEHYVDRKINSLHKIANTGSGRGRMAELRRGVGKYPGEIPELWGVIFNRMPEELLGRDKASHAEWAVYTSLTLYALHQQSNEKFMYVQGTPIGRGISIGKAASMLVKNDDDDEDRIRNRLGLVVTATSPSNLAYYLRGVIQLLSREEIGIDYARLAKELYLISRDLSLKNHEISSEIKLNWGRDFYMRKIKKPEDSNDEQ